VGLSDSANQGLLLRNFLRLQGYSMPAVIVYQDNMSCMALLTRGRSGGERTRHIDIRYFWMKDREDKGEATIAHKGTSELYADVLTKPLQGSQFVYEWVAHHRREGKQARGACGWVGQECSLSEIFSLRTPSDCALRSQLYRSHHLYHSHHCLVVLLRAVLFLFAHRSSP
jgi:hypothetical protein